VFSHDARLLGSRHRWRYGHAGTILIAIFILVFAARPDLQIAAAVPVIYAAAEVPFRCKVEASPIVKPEAGYQTNHQVL